MFVKRAYYSLRKKFGQNLLILLLLVILFSVTLGLLIAFLSFQSEVRWMQRTLGSSVTLTPVAWRGTPEGTPEGSEVTRNENIPLSDAQAFVDNPMVETYNYVTDSFPVDFEDFEQVVGEDIDLGYHQFERENSPDSVFGDGYIFPVSDSSRYEAFTVYGFRLTEGSHFSPEQESSALISQELAEQNGLQVGDTITLSQANYIKTQNLATIPEDRQTLTLTISGMFTGPDKEDNGYTYFRAVESPYNYVFASFAAASPFVDYPGYDGTPLDRVTAYLKDPGDMEQFLQETQGKFQIEKTGGAVTSFGLERSDITLEEYREKFEEQPFYQLTSDRELYDMVGKPLEQTRDLMGLFLAALLASSLVILLLIVALQVRSRKREFAILLSMGEARGKVIGQICLEVLTVLLAAALLGGLVGSVLVAPAAERTSLSLLSDQVDNTQADRESLLEEAGSVPIGSFSVPGDFVNSRDPGKTVVYATFTAAAKESGLTYATVEMDKVHPAGQRVLTIFVAFDDAHTVNNIFELNNLNAVKTSDFVKEVETPSTKSPSKEQDPAESIRQKNERFMAHFHGEDAQPVKQEEVNPMTPEGMNHEGPSVSGSGKSENETRQTSLSSKDEGVGRPSVRAKINAYREEQRSTALTQEERERIAQEYLESMKGGR